MLLWFVDKKVTELALKQGVLIEEKHVECQLEMITDAVACLLVEQVLKQKHNKMT